MYYQLGSINVLNIKTLFLIIYKYDKTFYLFYAININFGLKTNDYTYFNLIIISIIINK